MLKGGIFSNFLLTDGGGRRGQNVVFLPQPSLQYYHNVQTRPGWVVQRKWEWGGKQLITSPSFWVNIGHHLTHLCSNQSDLQTTPTTPRSNESSSHTTTYSCALAHQKNGKSLAKYFSILRTLTAHGKGGAKIDSDLNKDYKNYFSWMWWTFCLGSKKWLFTERNWSIPI